MTTPCHRTACPKPADIRHADLDLCASHYRAMESISADASQGAQS